MRYLLDTNILLRLVHVTDAGHPVVNTAVAALDRAGHTFHCGIQNIAEFWNVTTRPASARGGFGQTPTVAASRLAVIETLVEVLMDSRESHLEWKQLIVRHSVSGVQVYDARLVALMNVHGVRHILTLNAGDFARYDNLIVVTPEQAIAS